MTAPADAAPLTWVRHNAPAQSGYAHIWIAADRWLIRPHGGGGVVLVDFTQSPPADWHATCPTAAKALAATNPTPACPEHGTTVIVNGARVCHVDDCGRVFYLPAPPCVTGYFLAGWTGTRTGSPCCTYPVVAPVLNGRAVHVPTCVHCGRDYTGVTS